VKPYLSPAGFKILAHRGSTEFGAQENTLAAFQAAVDAGVGYLETDVQATKDGVAVLFHDRIVVAAGKSVYLMRDFKYDEVDRYLSGENGLRLPMLSDALTKFPTARFNLDLKTKEAIAPTIAVIKELGCENRVLVSSFSGTRRRKALKSLPGVATSPDALLVLRIWLATKIGKSLLLWRLLKDIDVLQVPIKIGFLRFDSKSFIDTIHGFGVEIHYWTINEVAEARRLKELGADGIVTDFSKLMMSVFGNKRQE
jgi:glycerophosphoryl diester phosphodiesterase